MRRHEVCHAWTHEKFCGAALTVEESHALCDLLLEVPRRGRAPCVRLWLWFACCSRLQSVLVLLSNIALAKPLKSQAEGARLCSSVGLLPESSSSTVLCFRLHGSLLNEPFLRSRVLTEGLGPYHGRLVWKRFQQCANSFAVKTKPEALVDFGQR